MLYPLLGIAVIIAFFALFVLSIKTLFNLQSSETIRHHHKDDAQSPTFTRKYPEADVKNYWWTFFLTGTIISLALVITAFEWTLYQPKSTAGPEKPLDGIEEFIVVPPQTKQPPKTPPPSKEELQPKPRKKITQVKKEPKVKTDRNVLAQKDINVPPESTPNIAPKPNKPKKKKPLVHAEKMPQFPGGKEELMKYLGNINAPQFAKENNLEGIVYVSFVVDKHGNVTNVSIKRGVHKVLNEAVIEHVENMPTWTPGKQGGKKVAVRYTLPFRFEFQ